MTSVISFTIWVPGMEFRPSGLTASTFTHHAILLAPGGVFNLCVGISQRDLPVLVAPPPLCFVLDKCIRNTYL